MASGAQGSGQTPGRPPKFINQDRFRAILDKHSAGKVPDRMVTFFIPSYDRTYGCHICEIQFGSYGEAYNHMISNHVEVRPVSYNRYFGNQETWNWRDHWVGMRDCRPNEKMWLQPRSVPWNIRVATNKGCEMVQPEPAPVQPTSNEASRFPVPTLGRGRNRTAAEVVGTRPRSAPLQDLDRQGDQPGRPEEGGSRSSGERSEMRTMRRPQEATEDPTYFRDLAHKRCAKCKVLGHLAKMCPEGKKNKAAQDRAKNLRLYEAHVRRERLGRAYGWSEEEMDQFKSLEREQAEMRKEMRETLHEHVQRIQRMLQPPERRSGSSSSNGGASGETPMEVDRQAPKVEGAAAVKQEASGAQSTWAKEAEEELLEERKQARREQLPRKKVVFREVTTATATATTTTTSSSAAEMILPEADPLAVEEMAVEEEKST